MEKIKRGSTLQATVRFTPEEWSSLYPFDLVSVAVAQGQTTHCLEIEFDEASQTALITGETSDWRIGSAKMDIRIVKDGKTIMFPGDGVISFQIVASVATGCVGVTP